MRCYTDETISRRIGTTADGFLVCRDAALARVGTQIYHTTELLADLEPDDDDWIEVERPAAEVFAERSMRSFEGKPLVMLHPSQGEVTPQNWRQLAAGHVVNARRGPRAGSVC